MELVGGFHTPPAVKVVVIKFTRGNFRRVSVSLTLLLALNVIISVSSPCYIVAVVDEEILDVLFCGEQICPLITTPLSFQLWSNCGKINIAFSFSSLHCEYVYS